MSTSKKLTLISITIHSLGLRLARFAYLPGDGKTISWENLEKIFPEMKRMGKYDSIIVA